MGGRANKRAKRKKGGPEEKDRMDDWDIGKRVGYM